jgi:hypothetical protein
MVFPQQQWLRERVSILLLYAQLLFLQKYANKKQTCPRRSVCGIYSNDVEPFPISGNERTVPKY